MQRNSGYTLVEVMIVLSILAVILSGALITMRQGSKNFEQTVSNTVANTKGNRALNTIITQFSGAGQGTVAPVAVAPFSTPTVRFQTVSGWDGAPTWSGDVVLQLAYEQGELNNGLDDDNDGFIDECEVILIQDEGTANEIRQVLVRRVSEMLAGELPNGLDDNGNGLIDESGFCIDQDAAGTAATIRLSVQRLRPEGGLDVQTLETTVWLRN